MKQIWYLATAAKNVKNSAFPIMIQGQRLVLFRGKNGEIAALRDLCPHRHVSLSKGLVIDGQLECPYHGMRFDSGGLCKTIPSSINSTIPKTAHAQAIEVREADESIWILLDSQKSAPDFNSLWPQNLQNFRFFELEYSLASSPDLIIENFVDCSHTGFVHKGLFRGSPDNSVEAQIDWTDSSVRVETTGENNSQSALFKIFARKAGPIKHVDEYIAPYKVEVTYSVGNKKIVTVSICTPESNDKTRVTTRVYMSPMPFGKILIYFLKSYTKRILLQDIDILEDQHQQIKSSGDRFYFSTASDAPIIRVRKAYFSFFESDSPFSDASSGSQKVRYKL